MTTHRYQSPKRGTGWDDIVAHCRKLSGKQVDPKVLQDWRAKTGNAIRQLFKPTGRGIRASLDLTHNKEK